MPGRVTSQRCSFLLPPPCWMKYCSMLSQSILVRQKMMAWSILCSLMALTVYSPFSTLMASDHISKTAKRTHSCFRVHRGKDYLGLNVLLSARTCRISSGSGVVFGVDFIRLSKTKQGGTKMTVLFLFHLANAFLILKHLTAVAIQFCCICIIQ